MMDRRFLEFLGHTFLNAARGQARLEEMADWFERHAPATGPMNEWFRKYYGLPARSADDARRDADAGWKAAIRDFQEHYGQWVRLMGAVPLSEHLRLKQEIEDLRKENAELKQAAGYLQSLVSGEGGIHAETLTTLKALSRQQSEQYGALVRSFSDLMQGRTASFPDEGGSAVKDVDADPEP